MNGGFVSLLWMRNRQRGREKEEPEAQRVHFMLGKASNEEMFLLL